MLKLGLLGLTIAFNYGCSTFATLQHSENHKYRCYENSIPRVYSGVFNDFAVMGDDKIADKELIIYDLPFSLFFDTAFLPYTIYMQAEYGNMCR